MASAEKFKQVLADNGRGLWSVDVTKHPKMLIVCEDTNVSPFVQQFLEEEGLMPGEISRIDSNAMTAFSLETLQGVFAREGESFMSEELTAKTRFGEYRVTANLFTANSYSEYLQKLHSKIASRQDFASNRSIKNSPVSQIGGAKIIALLDKYIRERLFNRPFDPAQNNK